MDASSQVVIDEGYFDALKVFYKAIGREIDEMIKAYISQLQEVRDTAIMEGEIAQSLDIYISCAESLKNAAKTIGNELHSLVSNFLQDVDDADEFLF